MVKVKEIAAYLNEELDINGIEDNSNNGLQIENTGEIKKIAFAVDACLETFEKAVQSQSQLLIVHHGMIWEGLKAIRGETYRKIKYLINNNLALYAVHLPLDRHEKYGNNIQLALLLKLKEIKPFGYYNNKTIGFMGKTDSSLEKIKKILLANNMLTESFDFGRQEIKKIAVISGNAPKEAYQAIAVGADLYLTGEKSYNLYHLAKENRMNIICAGHYNTEVWGVKALMPLLKKQFKVQVEFIDNPVPM